MAKNKDKVDVAVTDAAGDVEDQTPDQVDQTGQQVQLRVDERKMKTTYANAFRTNGTAEEVMMDFGLNTVSPPRGEDQNPEITFKINDRVIMNYYSAGGTACLQAVVSGIHSWLAWGRTRKYALTTTHGLLANRVKWTSI